MKLNYENNIMIIPKPQINRNKKRNAVWVSTKDCWLKIADLYNIPNDNVKTLVPNFFDKEK